MNESKTTTCRTCRHWANLDEQNDELKSIFTRNGERYNLGLCRKASGTSDERDPTSLAFAEDASDYRANFRTSADFGCVMHEPTFDQAERAK